MLFRIPDTLRSSEKAPGASTRLCRIGCTVVLARLRNLSLSVLDRRLPMASQTGQVIIRDRSEKRSSDQNPMDVNKVTHRLSEISISGARQHNLKNISVRIPRNTLTVITGLSGSGKSSLAFDTIYAEGQRRYVETLSAYARQFLDQMERPDVDSIEGLSPSISIDQKDHRPQSHAPPSAPSPRSTIICACSIPPSAFRIAPFAAMKSRARPRNRFCDTCFRCGRRIGSRSWRPSSAAAKASSKRKWKSWRARVSFERVLMEPCVRSMRKSLSISARITPSKSSSTACSSSRASKSASKPPSKPRRNWPTALVLISVVDGEERLYSRKLACAECGTSVPELEPRSFSFNSPYGACEECPASAALGFRCRQGHRRPVEAVARRRPRARRRIRRMITRGDRSGRQIAAHQTEDTPWEKLPAKARTRTP